MNKKDCGRMEKCVFAENCEWGYLPRANYRCFCRRTYSRFKPDRKERGGKSRILPRKK